MRMSDPCAPFSDGRRKPMTVMPYEIRECKTGSHYSTAPTLELAHDTCDRLWRTTGRYFVIQKVKDYA
jgi:hypothetical protein